MLRKVYICPCSEMLGLSFINAVPKHGWHFPEWVASGVKVRGRGSAGVGPGSEARAAFENRVSFPEEPEDGQEEPDAQVYLDFRPFMDMAPTTVRQALTVQPIKISTMTAHSQHACMMGGNDRCVQKEKSGIPGSLLV